MTEEPLGTAAVDGSLERTVREVMQRHWTSYGYTVPHMTRYPHQWLWDSCFHSIIWAALEDERAVTELASVFRHQDGSGFVPHIAYDGQPALLAEFWGRESSSSITQPPMYGHAAAVLVRRGFDIRDETLERCREGLRFLLRRRHRVDGLVVLCHPWESGADDSPRWDGWFGRRWDRGVWYRRKGELMGTIVRDVNGAPIANPAFLVGSAGFNALVAFNAHELASIIGDDQLLAEATELAELIDRLWVPALETWADAAEAPCSTSRIQTSDSLLPLLVVDRPPPSALLDSSGFGTAFGPAGVHQGDPTYDPGAYWRGSTWPQIIYLLAVAARRRGDDHLHDELHARLVVGARRSSLAEHWHAETGRGLGAAPQSWTGLAIVST